MKYTEYNFKSLTNMSQKQASGIDSRLNISDKYLNMFLASEFLVSRWSP